MTSTIACSSAPALRHCGTHLEANDVEELGAGPHLLFGATVAPDAPRSSPPGYGHEQYQEYTADGRPLQDWTSEALH